MLNGLRTSDKLTAADFATNGDGLTKDLESFAAAGCNIFSIRTRATSASAVSEIALNESVPAGSVLLGYKVTALGATTMASSTDIGVGTAADPDQLFETASSNLAAAGDSVFGHFNAAKTYGTNTPMQIASTDGSGADAGTLIGDFAVHLWGYIPASVEV